MSRCAVLALLMLSACAAFGAPSVVKIAGREGAWHLTFNGKPYFVQGGGGDGSRALLKAIGGNSFRTWGADKAKRDLDEAARHGQTVMLGFWLGHAQHGFSYVNPRHLADTEKSVLETVRAIKDHPALLCYTLGNEMELGEPHPKEMWAFINQLAEKVKAIDPNHPVGTVIADIWKEKADQMNAGAPALDFVGLNSYGGALSVGKRWRELGGKIPYFVTEYGPPGAGEHAGRASNGLPYEWTSTRKAAWYREVYEKTILADKGKYCLGAYVFTWGSKNEISPTWFGTLLPSGESLAVVDELAKLWGRRRANKAPRIEPLKVAKETLAVGEEFAASVKATDPDGDKLAWKWELVEEAQHYNEAGLGLAAPAKWSDAIVSGQGTTAVTVKLPKPGKFRLYATCYDRKGNAAYANIPLVAR